MPSGLYDQVPFAPDPLQVPESVMTIGAHPDDAEFGAGGTIFTWTQTGTDVTLVIATDGSMGSWDPHIDQADLVADRRREQMAAAAILGVASVAWLGQPDGELQQTRGLRKAIASLIRTHRPDVVLTHDPWQRYQLHPDHRATGFLAIDAVVAAREPRFYPDQQLEAHRPSAILLWSADEPDHAEPIDDRAFEAKVEALLCHASQSETTMGDASRSEDARARFIDTINEWMSMAGEPFGLARAETFKRLTP
jgi:LmbE family N-acetylglucosaminyl deacetylase